MPRAAVKQLSPAQWVAAARAALCEEGVDALNVERLAQRLGVTKGSFYWHFANRDALVQAVLEDWESAATEQVVVQLSAIVDPHERLRALFALVGRAQADRAIYVALAASREPAVRAALTRVAKKRMRFMENIFREVGMSAAAARHRALLAYSAYVGLLHLMHEAAGALPRASDLRGYFKDQVDLLFT